jgi:hypothetical protein
MKTTFNATDLLNNISHTLEKPEHTDPAERLFDNLVKVFALIYEDYAALPFLDSITDEKERGRMLYMHNRVRQDLNTLIYEKKWGPLLQRALELDEDALDKGCAIMIELFFDGKTISRPQREWENRQILVNNNIELQSDLGQEMLKAADDIYYDYKKLQYRAIAGQIFGLFDTDIEADEYRNQAANLLEKAINDVYDRHYPNEPNPPAY